MTPMNTREILKPEAALDDLKAAARLINALELRSTNESDARTLNACEQAIRDGIALFEAPQPLIRAVPLEWERDRLYGVRILVGHGLGLKYFVAKNVDTDGWTWTLGSGAGPVEPSEEAAIVACQNDFTERLRVAILPAAAD
jgi:hypothetical protein